MSLSMVRQQANSIRKRLCQYVMGSAALLLVSGALAQGMPAELAKSWQATKLPLGTLSLLVQEVNGPDPGGQRLAAVNTGVARNPASVMKMVTTWSGLSALGPDYTWRTTFLARNGGKTDAEGTLSGPLYLQAGGDPYLSIESLWSLLRELRLRGIKNLTELVVDRSIFGQVQTDPGVFDGAADRPYNASPDAMMVGLGAVRLVFQADDKARKWIPIVDPPLQRLRVNGDVQWSDVACPGSPSIATQLTSAGKDLVINLAGTAAGSCGEFTLYRLALSQPEYFSALFQVLWKELGGTLAKGVTAGQVPANATPVVWSDSRTLADIIRMINKQSNNVMARTLLLTLGAEKNGRGATARSGSAAALEVLASQGVDTKGWVIDNGSGLSREARLTADGLAGMLATAWRSPLMPEFMSSLAISGVDGTVRRRMRNGETRGMAHLKTGTLRDSQALAGYVLGASGKRYVLVAMVNDERASAARPFYDHLVNWLARQ